MDKLPNRTDLGDLLKQWRGIRGRSQLDISVDTGISQRQISFIESGRSVPSRTTLMGIAEALLIPLRYGAYSRLARSVLKTSDAAGSPSASHL